VMPTKNFFYINGYVFVSKLICSDFVMSFLDGKDLHNIEKFLLKEKQRYFITGTCSICFCIKSVIHCLPPSAIENYFNDYSMQEKGS